MTIFTTSARITQRFGENPDYYKTLGGHEGIDLVPTGSDWTIRAVMPGLVIVDEDAIRGPYGLYVAVYHWGVGQVWYYCHLAINIVRAHDILKPGDIIGTMGGTSTVAGMDATGKPLSHMPAHLHLMGYRPGRNLWDRMDRAKGYAGMIDLMPTLMEGGYV